MNKNPTTATVKTPADELHRRRLDEPGLRRRRHVPADRRAGALHPGARTNWHRHANGQLLVCTDGVGLVGTRDGHTVTLRAGESVWTPAGEEHFHGGTAENMMCHYAILDAAGDGEATTWLEPVTDEQYTAAHTAAQG